MIFVVVGLWSLWGAVGKSRWDEVPCTLGKFEIVASPKDPSFRPDLSFSYEYAGQRYTGTRLWADREGTDDYQKLSDIREPLFIGPEGFRSSLEGLATTCRVNPGNPAEAVLRFNRTGDFVLGTVFTIMGSLFAMIGLSLSFGSLSRTMHSPAEGAPGAVGTGFSVAAFGLFALAGFGVLFGVVVPKAREWFAMRSWQETTAEVISGKVGSHRGNKGGTTYSVDFFYRYDFGGREYRSNRYDLLGGSSSGYDAKADVVRAHAARSKLQVFVDPEKPWHAIVKRSPGWWGLFALFPLPFIAVGVGGIWGALRKGAKAAAATRSKASTVSDPPIFPGAGTTKGFGTAALAGGEWQPTRLKPGCSVLVLLLIALFWNGLVSAFVWEDIKLYRTGSWIIGIVVSVFLIPFVGIGLMIIGGVVQHVMLLFGPRFEVQLDQAELRPGGTTRLRWRRAGGRGTVKDFDLLLLGREEVLSDGESPKRARRGKSVFYEEVLFTTRDSLATAQGQVELKIPEDAVPSFAAGNHVIRWMICLRAQVEGMPTIRDDRDLLVRPPKLSS